MDDALRIGFLALLILANALFVVGEYAVVAAPRVGISERAAQGERSAGIALALMDEPVRLISTVQVGITAVGILTGAIGEPLVRGMIGDELPGWLAFLIAFGAVTYLTVVFGELVPKAITLDRTEAMALRVARPMRTVESALRPVVWGLEVSARAVLRLLGVRDLRAGRQISTAEELHAVVAEAHGRGVIPGAQEELLHRVFDFARREAADAMIPAAAVDWLEADASAAAALDEVIRHPRSRYPVAEGSLDHLLGSVHVRELVAAAQADPSAAVRALARPVPIVPETKDLGALLHELRDQRQHLAVVADEYGGTLGIVTMEDILEEIVGEIQNEYDLPGYALDWLDERVVEMDGSMSVDDFSESVGVELPQAKARTMAGLVFDALGRRPCDGDRVTAGPVELVVERTDGLRIARLRATLPEEAGRDSGPEGAEGE